MAGSTSPKRGQCLPSEIRYKIANFFTFLDSAQHVSLLRLVVQDDQRSRTFIRADAEPARQLGKVRSHDVSKAEGSIGAASEAGKSRDGQDAILDDTGGGLGKAAAAKLGSFHVPLAPTSPIAGGGGVGGGRR